MAAASVTRRSPAQAGSQNPGHGLIGKEIRIADLLPSRISRFWERVTKTDGCWLWDTNDSKGYGRFKPYGTQEKVSCHRLSFVLAHGPIPEGKLVMHACDTPLCVNPTHLVAGTPLGNMLDMVKKGRRPFSSGECHSHSRLTNSNVLEIRRLYAGGLRQWQIAERFSISQQTVSLIVNRKVWGHVA